MPSDHFDFVRARATGCRPISPGLDLVRCRQRSTDSFKTGLFPALKSCSKIFLRAGRNSVVLKDSTEHAEPLFIALTVLFKNVFDGLGLLKSESATCSFFRYLLYYQLIQTGFQEI